MKKVISLLIAVLGIILSIPASAQFAPAPSLPNVAYATQTFTAAGNAVQVVNGVSTATLEVTGTYSALSFNLQCTNNATFVNLPVVLVSSGPVITTITGASTAANGVYYTSLNGCTKIKFLVNSITGTNAIFRLVASPMATLEIPFINPLTSLDPCVDRTIAKKNLAVDITTATTTNLVSASGTTNITPCSFYATVSGTNPTLVFKSGTTASTPCDTGAVSMTGTITPTTAVTTIVQFGELGSAGSGNQLCLTTGGTPAVHGFLTYVQQ